MAERFAASYRATRHGLGHSLVVIHNGVGAGELAQFKARFDGIADRHVVTPTPMLDLEAYRRVISEADADVLCFLNSYSRLRVDGWLAKLTAPLARDDVGVVGAMGSQESLRGRRRFRIPPQRGDLRQLDITVRSIWRYPSAPNPHLRTNAFAARTAVLRELRWPEMRTKDDALRFESGRGGLSDQIVRSGRELLVVDAAGTSYSPASWARSGTFRLGDQSGLLVTDNRSDEYASAAGEDVRFLEGRAWTARRR